MSEETAIEQANLREIARLRTALLRANADNAALLTIALRAGQVQTYEQAMVDVAVLKAPHPGAALLAQIRRAAEHLPGNPDAAERILSQILEGT